MAPNEGGEAGGRKRKKTGMTHLTAATRSGTHVTNVGIVAQPIVGVEKRRKFLGKHELLIDRLEVDDGIVFQPRDAHLRLPI